MPDVPDTKHDPIASGSPKAHSPDHKGGNPIRNAQEWGGGSRGSKDPGTSADKRSPGPSAKP